MSSLVTKLFVYYLQALDTFNTAIVSPIYYVMFTSLTILASVIMFKVISRHKMYMERCMWIVALVHESSQCFLFLNRTGIGKMALKLSQRCVDLLQYFQALFFSIEPRTWSRVTKSILSTCYDYEED